MKLPKKKPKVSKRIAIVVAGGKGLRMGAELPKQFICLKGKPILMHSLERFQSCDKLILVLPKDHFAYWEELKKKHQFELNHELVEGGETRFHSVQNALKILDEKDSLIAIHDGVRPLVSKTLVKCLFDFAEQEGAVLPAIPIVDSLRHVETNKSTAVARSEYRAIQTPQVFDLEELKRAYQTDFKDFFTDDASVYEYAYNKPILLLEGERENIKITHEEDLILADYFLSK